VPNLRALIVGEGYMREELEARRLQLGAEDWVELPGRVDDDTLTALYRQAWAVTSCSAREGWGMTLTEAAACATPAVVTRIAGHVDAVTDGVSGLIVDDQAGLVGGLRRVLTDTQLREHLSTGARTRADSLTWEATAFGALEVLARAAMRRGAGTGQ
jgi:glycosyltransferase involved in cell wall biosynthesis